MTLSDRTTAENPLLAGREAFEKHAWQEAFDLLSTIDAQDGLPPDDLERLAEAAMWALHPEECIGAYERAYAAYVESGNPRRASYAAVRLLRELHAQGAMSVLAGWMYRVTRLLKDEPECVEHGYLAYAQSRFLIGAGDLDQALALGQRAFDLACKFADRDLQALALDAQGQVLVAQGQVDDGMALMSEAAAAAVAGELGVLASATVYCNIVGTCRGLSDYTRAGEWIDPPNAGASELRFRIIPVPVASTAPRSCGCVGPGWRPSRTPARPARSCRRSPYWRAKRFTNSARSGCGWATSPGRKRPFVRHMSWAGTPSPGSHGCG